MRAVERRAELARRARRAAFLIAGIVVAGGTGRLSVQFEPDLRPVGRPAIVEGIAWMVRQTTLRENGTRTAA
jgi:hypothetical protein